MSAEDTRFRAIRWMFIACSLLWVFPTLVGVLLCFINGFSPENFGVLLVGLTGFLPNAISLEQGRPMVFFGWAAGVFFLQVILGWRFWFNRSLPAGVIFVFMSVGGFLAGGVQIIAHLSAIH